MVRCDLPLAGAAYQLKMMMRSPIGQLNNLYALAVEN
jgi:hypothetical protein